MLEEAVSQDADLVVEGYKKVSDDGRILFEEKYKYEIFEGANVKNSFLPRMIGSCPEKKIVFLQLYVQNYISEK